jgi:hypothetical protein
MAGFKQPDFMQRQEAVAQARQVALERHRAKIADPALAERLKERAGRAAERSALKVTREIERAEKKAREAERAQQAERDAAIEAERVKAESAISDRALQARRPQIAIEAAVGLPQSRLRITAGFRDVLMGAAALI